MKTKYATVTPETAVNVEVTGTFQVVIHNSQVVYDNTQPSTNTVLEFHGCPPPRQIDWVNLCKALGYTEHQGVPPRVLEAIEESVAREDLVEFLASRVSIRT